MPCYHPWKAYQTSSGEIIFSERGADIVRTLELPCRQCIGCRLERSRQWAVRCMHEAQMHEQNCFITLTYSNEHIADNQSLNYRDFQLFLKRLRKHFGGKKIRFYMCGEYGETFTRPHFHACLFGIDMPDREPINKLASGSKIFESKILTKIWGKGHTTVGAVTFESAAYVARYVMKKVTGDLAQPHYTFVDRWGEIHERTPEFNRMSLKPGIGANWLERFSKDVYPSDEVIANGHASKPPRYYDKIFEKNHPEIIEDIKYQRYLDSLDRKEDNTRERLEVREIVVKARTTNLKRSID